MNKFIRKIRFPFKLLFASIRYPAAIVGLSSVNVMSKADTIDKLIENDHLSLARFGDGELEMLTFKNIGFQDYNENLSTRLISVLENCPKNKNCLVALPDSFLNKDKMIFGSSLFWFFHKSFHYSKYKKYLHNDYFYGNTSVTRPYHDYVKKNNAKIIFDKFKKLINNRKILIVEGKGTRLGVGNDLLSTASSISRITTVNKNAFSIYNKIIDAVLKFGTEFDIILISLGPTATLLSYDLSCSGIRAIDTGHIDIEYEWMNISAKSKVNILGKNVNEAGVICNEEMMEDIEYKQQIISHIE